MALSPDTHWERLRATSRAVGLTVAAVLDRETVDPAFAGHETTSPATLHPGYRRAVALGSGGGAFWRRFRAAHPVPPSPEADPLDHFTEREVAPILVLAREADPRAVAAFPFRHPRQLLPFLGLLKDIPALAAGPFGVAVDQAHGPWFAWRAAILTAAEYPLSEWAAESPCVPCPAPCVSACPARAVDKGGFRWRDCVDFRVAQPTCRERCLARSACPVGPGSRYPEEAIAYHYRASLRMIRTEGVPPPPPQVPSEGRR